ncbi:ATPase synthesis protein 25 mitochondrial [Claviceps purpurea]|nr:ATPase synthesis protein 25 mitochondrial [Claviceps purpurea]
MWRQGEPGRSPRPLATFFSTERSIENITPAAKASQQPAENHDEVSEESSSAEQSTGPKPWFLEVEAPSHPPSLHTPKLPEAPAGSPALITPMIKYIFEDMGLDEIALLDLRDLDPPAALGPNLIMLFATARSERHLHVCSGRFVRWLGRNYKVNAKADGLIGAGELKTKLRRLRKKAKLMGTNTMMVPDGDNGISTGWVCVNFSTSDEPADETASFDDSGRLSGFGTVSTGTTVVVQCMTESRRSQLDLIPLWRGILKRNLEANMKIRGQGFQDPKDLEALVSSKFQLPEEPEIEGAAAQWANLQQASAQQHRYFSTSARRPSSRYGAINRVTEVKAEDGVSGVRPLRATGLGSFWRCVPRAGLIPFSPSC